MNSARDNETPKILETWSKIVRQYFSKAHLMEQLKIGNYVLDYTDHGDGTISFLPQKPIENYVVTYTIDFNIPEEPKSKIDYLAITKDIVNQ